MKPSPRRWSAALIRTLLAVSFTPVIVETSPRVLAIVDYRRGFLILAANKHVWLRRRNVLMSMGDFNLDERVVRGSYRICRLRLSNNAPLVPTPWRRRRSNIHVHGNIAYVSFIIACSVPVAIRRVSYRVICRMSLHAWHAKCNGPLLNVIHRGESARSKSYLFANYTGV